MSDAMLTAGPIETEDLVGNVCPQQATECSLQLF
jgi:hypothetical protein